MSDNKIAIRMFPTPGTEEFSDADILKLSRIMKRPPEKIRDRLAAGKGLTIVTPNRPKVRDLVQFLKSMGFQVTTGPLASDMRTAESLKTTKRVVKRRKVDQADLEELHVGDRIENLYEVRDIKRGGMGAVYLVRHLRWNTMMAVKSLLKRLMKSQEDQALFVKEAETWIDIGFHPNIAACYYVKNINDHPHIFIEYVDGGSLFELIRSKTPIGWDMNIDLMVQVGDGLAHAHSKGLVHRDVKPANCMITSDGIIKVTDFGLTKRRGQTSSPSATSEISLTDLVVRDTHAVTAAGMGTPSYMAPEMWTPDAEVGPQADMYAFGVMFFEMCCGRKPFFLRQGERRDKLALAHLKEPPPRPRSIRSDIPEPIEKVILKCLEKDQYRRYESFGEVRKELEAAYEAIFDRSFPRPPSDELELLSDALNNRAVSLMDLNHYEEAEAALRKAVEYDPHHPEAVYNLGLLEWNRTENPDRELCVKLEEAAKTPEYTSRGAHLLGRCLLTLGDPQKALEACELSVSAGDAPQECFKTLAIALIGVGRNDEAVERLEKYVESFPDDQAMGWLVSALVATGRKDEAAQWTEKLPEGSKLTGRSVEDIADSFVYSGLNEKMALEGHRGWIHTVGHFPKSPAVMTGSRDRTLKIWDMTTGQEFKSISVIGEPPAQLWISPDEKLVAIASDKSGSPVKVLDPEQGRFVGNLMADGGTVTALGFSEDGRRILKVEDNGVARLWNTDPYKVEATFKVPPHTAADVVFLDSAKPLVYVAGRDRNIKRISPVDSTSVTFERSMDERINVLEVSADGKLALTAGRDKQAYVWNGETGALVGMCRAHDDQITAAAINSSRNLAATYDPKAGAKLWEADTGKVLRSFTPGEAEVLCLAFSPDGAMLFAGGRDMALRVWDVRGRAIWPELILAKIRPVTKQIKSGSQFKAMMDRAKKAYRSGAFATAYRWLRKAQTLPGYERSDQTLDMILRMKDKGRRVGLHGGWNKKSLATPSGVRQVVFSPSAINFLTAHSDHAIRMWSTKTADCLITMKGHTNLVTSIAYSHNGRSAVSGGDDKSVRIWDLHSGKNIAICKGHTESVGSVDYSPDGALVVSGSWDGTAKIWSSEDGGLLKNLRGHQDKVSAVAFSGNSEWVFTGGFDGIVKMWEVSSGRHLRDLRGHKDRIASIRVSSDGEVLVSGSVDGVARVWRVNTGTETRTLDSRGSGVKAVGISPDHRFVVTGGDDAILRIWDIVEGTTLREFQGHSKEITSAEFASHGRLMISSSVDGSVIMWELDWDWEFVDL